MQSRRKIDYTTLIKRDRIHTSLYSDPDVLTDEFERIFHRGWVYVGHAGEIPNPGDFRLKKIGRHPVIMVRDDHGDVRLLFNRCRHRGSTVCQLEAGNAPTFRCAYHGWTYRNNGELAGVPYQDGYGGSFRREEMGLLSVPRMDAYRGFIFGSLSPAGITLDDHLGRPAKEQIDLFVDLSPEGEIEVQAGVH
ncbi:MAG TPA: Rieske 2Fe-2S domain-containing protein, partial [Candidatus Binataceae bacterium]|nr:Rieske 2Fe-2S domain-containing protein [Candidatus Binataceae bacterium]